MSDDRYKILIVDDEPINIKTLAALLGKNELRTGFALSGYDAIDLLNKSEYDLVLLDVSMPGMDGFETCRIIRSNEKFNNLPIIFLTANVDPEFVVTGFQLKGNDYIKKPFNPVELILRIKTHLELSANRKTLQHYNEQLEKLVENRTREIKLLSGKLLEVQEEEKHNVARELHDETAQSIGALKLNLQLINKSLLDDFSLSKLKTGLEIVDQLLSQVKNISLSLHPTVLYDYGFKAAVNWLIERLNFDEKVSVIIELEVEDSVFTDISRPLFRILQEAVSNIRKHSDADWIRIRLSENENTISLHIEDNGKGFDVKTAIKNAVSGNSLGLISMRERTELIGGIFNISSAPGKGSIIEISSIPLKSQQNEY